MKTWQIGLTCAFVVALGVTLHAADNGLTQLNEQAAEYKKAGEPIELADFQITGVADADNAAIELRAAAQAIKGQGPAWTAYDKLQNVVPPLNEKQAKLLRAAVEQNIAAIAHFDAAMARKELDWQIKMTSPAIEILLRHLNGQRLLANYLSAHALLRHHEGNDAEAVADFKRLIFLSRAVDQQGFIVGHLVSLGNMGIANSAIEMIAPDLKIGPNAPAASPQQVNEIVALLLDDAPPRKGYRDGLAIERMAELDLARCIINGTVTRKTLGKLMGSNNPTPQITAESAAGDAVAAMRHLTNVISAFDQTTDWSTAISAIPGAPAELVNNPKQHPFAAMMLPDFSKTTLTHYRTTADRKLMATVLALRAYAGAHDGKLPEHLDDLVPEYLPQVPDDPMAQRQSLKYSAARAIVFSTGEDGQADDGSEKPAPNATRQGRWGKMDAVVHLQRPARK